jgi:hypothetical protein
MPAVPETRPEGQHDGPTATGDGEEEEEGSRLTESLLDNLPAWAFVALAIAALYMVWATLIIIDKYVGDSLPGIGP